MKIASLIFLLSSVAIFGSDTEPSRYAFDPDVRALSEVRWFTFGSVMFKPRTECEVVFSCVVQRDDAIRVLAEVYNRGTPEARVYVLAAFHYLAPAIFEQSRKECIGPYYYNPMVRSATGCFIADGTLHEFLIRIHRGDYDGYIQKYSEANQSPQRTAPRRRG